MSPQQVLGRPATVQTDIYAMGLILFEMITGRAPFEGDTPLSIFYRHVNTPPPSPRLLNAQVPEKLNRLILRCLEKDPDKRYQTADELRSDLAQIEKSIPAPERVVPAGKSSTTKRIPARFRWKKLRLPVLLALQGADPVRGPRVLVVDERYPVSDEHIVLDGHAFADERVALDLAVPADAGVLLHFHECPDLRIVADRTAVKVDELGQTDILAELHVIGYAEIGHTFTICPFCFIDWLHASSSFTTRSPACPSFSGRSPFVMHARKYSVSCFSASIWSTFGAYMSPER
jgi:hypothetical protein